MDQRSDIDDTLRRHYRRQWLRWLCSCGRRWQRCSPRREAETQRLALECRARLDDALAHMRDDPLPMEASR